MGFSSLVILSHRPAAPAKIVAVLYLAAMLMLDPAALLAGEIRYQVIGYASQHALVTLSGSSASKVTTSLSSDGLSVRISAPNAVFTAQETQSLPTLITGIQQVKRGAFTDLVISLSAASTLSASPGAALTRLFIQTRSFGGAKTSDSPEVPDASRAPTPLPSPAARGRYPIRLIPAGNQTLAKELGPAVVLPGCNALKPALGLTEILRTTAYALDVLWAWTSARPLEYLAEANCRCPAEKEEIKQLETLVKELTEELMQVRGVALESEPKKKKQGLDS